MEFTAKQLQEMTDATKICEEIEEVAAELTIDISLMFKQDVSEDEYMEINIPLSLKGELIDLIRPLLRQERAKVMAHVGYLEDEPSQEQEQQ